MGETVSEQVPAGWGELRHVKSRDKNSYHNSQGLWLLGVSRNEDQIGRVEEKNVEPKARMEVFYRNKNLQKEDAYW